LSVEIIEEADELHRRLFPDYVKPDGTVSAAVYMVSGQPDNEISVHLARLTTPVAALRTSGRMSFGVGAIVAAVPRSLAFDVFHAPNPDDESHSIIRGENTKLKCRQLAAATTVVLQPGSASA